MSDPSSRICYSGALLSNENNKNPIEELPGRGYVSHPVKIAIESPQTLSEEELEQIVDVWKRKPGRRRRRIVVNVNFYCCIDLLNDRDH